MAPFLLSFKVLVCFWKDFTAAWKIGWKRKEAAAVVSGCAMTGTSPYVSPILHLVVD